MLYMHLKSQSHLRGLMHRIYESHFSEEKKSKVHVVQDIYISKYFKELDRAIKLKIHIYHREFCTSEEKR